jgi:hypothetical protein
MGIEKKDVRCRLTDVSTEVKNELVEEKYNGRGIKKGNEKNDTRCTINDFDTNKRTG